MSYIYCRACLVSDKDLLTRKDIISSFNELSKLTMYPDDGLSQQFCRSCVNTMTQFIDFRTLCQKSDFYLRNCAEEEGITLDEIIKEEVVSLELELSDPINHGTDVFLDNSDEDTIKLEVEEPLIEEKNERRSSRIKQNKETRNKTVKINDKMEKSDDKTNFPCGLCLAVFEDKTKVSEHLEGHKTDGQCSVCEEPFSCITKLFAHRINHIESSKHKSCHLCWRGYINDYVLENHYNMAHFNGQFPGLACKLCSKAYLTVKSLKRHISDVHGNNNAGYSCDQCDKKLLSRSSFKSHIKKQHLKISSVYNCDFCEYRSGSKTILKKHEWKYHSIGDYDTCDKCKKTFMDKEKYQQHTQDCDPLTVCPVCGKSILPGKSLDRHIKRVHTTENMFKCDQCTSSFRTKDSLRSHKDRHDGFKRHVCEYCKRRFYTASVLTKHRRVHTGEKPYKCEICGRGFMANHNRKVHMRVHGMDVFKNKEDTALTSQLTLQFT